LIIGLTWILAVAACSSSVDEKPSAQTALPGQANANLNVNANSEFNANAVAAADGTKIAPPQQIADANVSPMGDRIEHQLAVRPPLWGEESLPLLDLMNSGRFPAPLARLSVILTDLVPAQVEQLPLFTPIVVTPPMMPPILLTRYAGHIHQAQLIAPEHPLPEQRFVWHAAAV
jgi:hypothetical protein